MRRLGFRERWINLMMMCVNTMSYSVLINREPKGRIFPTQGLRQGDPIFPYLFLLCAEGLSAVLRLDANGGIQRGISVCRQSPVVSHLLFADDCIVFCNSSKEKGARITKILKVYNGSPGRS